VFESRVLRKMFDPRSDEVIRDWRKLHNENFIIFNLTKHYYSGYIRKK
jgi:hypothetical protein